MIEIDQLTPSQWRNHSEQAHLICFGQRKPAELDRIDFALVARHGQQLLGYMTCREMDAETLYWQYGGAFPGTQGTLWSWNAYVAYVNYCKKKYKRVTTLIENSNLPMLKMAMKVGYRIVGIRTYQGAVLLEHLLEF